MKINVLTPCAASGKSLKAGEQDVEEKDAKILISLGRAEPVEGKKKAEK